MAIQFLSICVGANQGAILTGAKNGVDRALAQKDLAFQGLNGFFYAERTIKHVNQALQATGRLPSASAQYVVWLTPPVLALAKRQQSLNAPVEFVQKHLLIVAQVANVVSSVALIAFGNPFFGTASLLFLTLGVLDENRLLPKGVAQGMHQYVQPIICTVGLVTGDALTKLLSLVVLVESVAEWYSPRQIIAPQSQLDLAKYTALRNQPVKINRAHIYYFAQEQSLQKKVLDHLRDKRTEWLQSKVKEVALFEMQKEAMEASCADRLGTTYKGAAEPELVSKLVLARMLEKDFWEEHNNPEDMITCIQMAILGNKIKEEEITQFWKDWTSKQPQGTANPEGSLSVYNHGLIKAMLYDFGILVEAEPNLPA